ncbi:MmcQ/YjbR family DNA-binding protein [Amycolatopsis tucumanensis]|uniref:MmcQ/YjbR family DNA-binding protein n=1 Tax=Amycolatopsis tucumanensis TaxID=401106 RepID=UPI003D71B389
MTRDDVIAWCLAQPGAVETYPFGEHVLVVKVTGKAFAYIGFEENSIALRCGVNAEEAATVRERHPDAMRPMGYQSRHGWNTITLDNPIPDADLHELLSASYDYARS